jgi:hypothetical protein
VEFAASMEHVMKFMRKLHRAAANLGMERQVVYVSYEKTITEPISSIISVFDRLGVTVDEDVAAYLWSQMRASQKQYLALADRAF